MTSNKLTNRNNWDTYGGGTGAAPGKNSYQKNVEGIGQYNIDPITYSNGRHKGYLVRFADIFGNMIRKGQASGLWSAIAADGSLQALHLGGAVTLPEAMRRCEQHRAANATAAAA